mmetsp:Transcript_1035/g.925  ORF Transcript_1035/g.925 Transcript_1035/m.925 type:complete len:138 (+) Transcript_1035:572-985(+)
MDAMKNYFEYTVYTSCGIPEITLKGTQDDWKKLREKVYKLKEMNKNNALKLDFWMETLTSVVDKIVDTALTKEVDVEFWKSIYKWGSGSGGARINGWILAFFPYLTASGKYYQQEFKPNFILTKKQSDSFFSGIRID